MTTSSPEGLMFLGQAAERSSSATTRMKHLRLMTGKSARRRRSAQPPRSRYGSSSRGRPDQLRSRGGRQPSQALALNVAARGGQLASAGLNQRQSRPKAG